MATYNGERFVYEQVSSILSQLGPQDELIVSDDGSGDDTLQIIHSFSDPRIKITINKSRRGIVGNFENALLLAQGDFLALADQDDVWLPGKIQAMHERMLKLQEKCGTDAILMLHSDAKVVDSDLNVVSNSLWAYQGSHPKKGSTLNKLLLQNDATGCTSMISRALLKKALPVPEKAMMHDWWFALVAASFGQLEFIENPLVLYRQHGANDTGAKQWGTGIALRHFIDLYHCADVLKEKEKVVEGVRLQANTFLERFEVQLSSRQAETIRAFLALPEKSYLVRKYLTLKYGLHYHGLLRNIFNLLLK